MSWLFIRKLTCLHKDKIKFTYKEEYKLVPILVFPAVIRQPKKSSDLSDLLSVPEFLTRGSKLLLANETLLAMETPLPKHREKRRNGRSSISVGAYKELRNHLVRILMPDYEAVSVCDVETASTTICEQHPDAALASSAFVGVSGEELVIRIKSDNRVAHVPVILLVKPGGDSKETQRNADLYVTMPFAISFPKAEIKSLITNREIIRGRYIHLTLGVDAPDDAEVDVPLSDGNREFVSLIRSLIEKRLTGSRLTVDELNNCMNMSRSSLYNRVKEVTGYIPAGYVRNVRLNKALILLISRKHTVVGVTDMMGPSDPKYFKITFKECFGGSPTKYINNL